MVRRRKRTYRRKKTINVPLVSTASGLAIFSALGGQDALDSALKGNIGGSVQVIADKMSNPASKAALRICHAMWENWDQSNLLQVRGNQLWQVIELEKGP